MALATKTYGSYGLQRTLERHSDASVANTALTVTIPTGSIRRLVLVTCRYSAAPTHAGVTVTLDSGAGAAYDTQLDASPANALNYDFEPAQEVIIGDDDAIAVTAPAGGAGITSQVAVYTEDLS